MTLKSQIESVRKEAAELERIYRETLADGNEEAFKQAIRQCAVEHPDEILLMAWVLRLEDQTPIPEAKSKGPSVSRNETRRWWTALATSAVLGIIYAICAGDKPPVPLPWEANPLFWIGWGPLTALGILFYLATIYPSGKRIYGYAGMGVALLLITIYTAVTVWTRTDDIAILTAIHLPFFAWVAVGAALILARPDPARQCYAFLVKSVETVVAGGIFFAAGGIFLGLTIGILAAVGVNLPERNIQTIGAWGIGATPVLALATVYDPWAALAEQDWAGGITRILRIVTQLILPLALVVLIVYVFWLVPAYFWRPFQERELLIVYNGTILAVLVLMTVVVSGPADERSPRHDAVLRFAMLALGGLVFFLNFYALAANAGRISQFGLTPNRYAVLGWNIVTLIMLAVIGIRQWRYRSQPWVLTFRESIARVTVLAVAWALWVLVGLPFSVG